MSTLVSTTINSVTTWLLLAPPQWSEGVTADLTIPCDVTQRLQGNEQRTALGLRIRTHLKFKIPLYPGDVPAFPTALQSLGGAPVACPFWPGMAGDTSYYTDAAYYAVLTLDGSGSLSSWSVVARASRPGSLSAGQFVVPLLIGYFDTTPNPDSESAEVALCDIDFQEASAITWISGGTPSLATGPTAAGGLTPPIFPLRPDWSADAPKTGGAFYELTRDELGYRRERAQAIYPQSPVRHITLGFSLPSEEDAPGAGWGTLLAVFEALGGTTASVWLPAELNEANLTANVASTDTQLSIDNDANLGANTFFLLDDGNQRAAVKSTSVANPLPLSAAVGASFVAVNTRLESLVLARFASSTITVTWLSPTVANASIDFRELPLEYATGMGETVGATEGAMTPGGGIALAHLYKFTVQYPTSPVVSYFSSFEFDISDGTNTWLGGLFEHGDIKETLNLKEVSVEITSRTFTGNPLALANPFSLEYPLLVEIWEAGVANANTLVSSGSWRRLFSGELDECEADGPTLKATCSVLTSLGDRQIPMFLFGPSCNYNVYSTGCGVNPASYAVGATLAAAATGATTITVQSSGTAWTSGSYAAHYFALGTITVGSGSTQQVRWISDSTAPSAGVITLTLATPLTASNGASATLQPGCNGSYTDAGGCPKFSNQNRFGGHFAMPIYNPLVLPTNPNQSKGK